MHDKIIFLDIDGVLVTPSYMGALKVNALDMNDLSIRIDKYGDLFDPRCVLYFEHIINQTNAKIVISSTWRLNGMDFLQDMWEDRQMAGEIVGMLDRGFDRGELISKWLEENATRKYVIVDDDQIEQKYGESVKTYPNLVKTYPVFGLDFPETKEIIKILNS